MIASTIFLYAATAFTLFSTATAETNYTSVAQFFNSLPECVKACGPDSETSVTAKCGDDFECACKTLVFVADDTNTTAPENITTSCWGACSQSDQANGDAALMDFLTSCLPFFPEFSDANFTSPNDNSTNSTTTSPSNGTSTGVPIATQSTNAGASLMMGSLFVVALPAVLSGLFM